MATTTKFSLLFILFLSVSIRVQGSGFSVNLIHRDSPQSPFYNPLDNLSDRMQKAVNRSINRANYFKKISSSTYSADDKISTSLSVIDFEFVMSISIGTPPRNFFAIADTGSDITWVQCEPCEVCYPQISPLFDPKTSSSYKDAPCASGNCFSCENNICQYYIIYGNDRSYSTGNVAFETLTFDSTGGRSIQLPNIAFGCAHENVGQPFGKKVSGLVGLGGDKLSLISQLGSKIDSKFSYCLVPSYTDFSSRFNFGSNTEIIGENVLSTPLISDPSQKTFYYLTLEGISVNENRVPFRSSASSTTEDDNIIIDSGTTLTYLPKEMYSQLESEFRNAIDAEPIIGPENFNLCYPLDESMKYPDVTVHFTDADIKLDPKNYFSHVGGGAVCLYFAPADGLYIYGNVAQINFLIEYDLKEKKVSFKPTDCTKQG